MNEPLTHERCSEMLHAYAEGTLPSDEAAAVREHLDGCAACRAEEMALRHLLAPADGLSAAEARELRAAVLASVRRSEADEEPVALRPPRPLFRRAAPVLAAAALIVGGIVFVSSDRFGGLDGGDTAAVGEAGGDDSQVADVRFGLAFRKPTTSRAAQVNAIEAPDAAPLQAEEERSEKVADSDRGAEMYSQDSGTGGGVAGAGSSGRRAMQGPPRPLYVRGAGKLTDRTLTLVGRYGLPLVLFPQSYTTDDAVELQEGYLVALANAAETEAQSQQVIDCGAQVLSQGDPVLPALATFGTFEGRPIFVLALAWTEADSGPLDRFMVWTWPANGCDQVPGYRAGRIGG